MLTNDQLALWDRESFFHPSTHLAQHARGETPSRIVTGGSGVYIEDRDGKRLLDAFAGLYCVNVGYGRQEVAEAIAKQARELAYYHAYVGTGTEASIKPLAEAIGFRYAYDANIKQYAHGAAIYVATPAGVIARYLLGIDFAPRDLRLAIVEASNNQLGSVTDKVLLLCYHYDPSVGKYGVAILNAVRIGFVGTVTGFLAFLFVSLRRERADSRMVKRT